MANKEDINFERQLTSVSGHSVRDIENVLSTKANIMT